MTSTVATLAWATPVDVIQLVSHLEVYEHSKPAMLALLTCHRYGNQAPIARLSTELIDMITVELLKLDYPKAQLAWEQEAICFEGRCGPEQHLDALDAEDIHRIFREVLQIRVSSHKARCPSTCKRECLSVKVSDDDVLERAKRHHKYTESHTFGQKRWLAAVNKNLIVQKIRKPLLANFGLDAVVSHHEMDALSRLYLNNPGDSMKQPSSSIRSYLTLPSKSASFWTGFDYGPRFMHTSLIDPSSLMLTGDHMDRFTRAMRLLALEISVHPSQLSQTISASSLDHEIVEDDKPVTSYWYDTSKLRESQRIRDFARIVKRLERRKQMQWPQLTMLLRQTAEIYQGRKDPMH